MTHGKVGGAGEHFNPSIQIQVLKSIKIKCLQKMMLVGWNFGEGDGEGRGHIQAARRPC